MTDDRLALLARRLPRAFDVRAVAIAPGGARAYDAADWRDALVVVERGEIELECRGGTRGRFGRGDLLTLAGLPLVAVHNRGAEPALLAVVARR